MDDWRSVQSDPPLDRVIIEICVLDVVLWAYRTPTRWLFVAPDSEGKATILYELKGINPVFWRPTRNCLACDDTAKEDQYAMRVALPYFDYCHKHLSIIGDCPPWDNYVSKDFVLNQLAGMSFSGQGSAYDFMKKCFTGKEDSPPPSMATQMASAGWCLGEPPTDTLVQVQYQGKVCWGVFNSEKQKWDITDNFPDLEKNVIAFWRHLPKEEKKQRSTNAWEVRFGSDDKGAFVACRCLPTRNWRVFQSWEEFSKEYLTGTFFEDGDLPKFPQEEVVSISKLFG